jgi:flagellar capping protein FliD
MKVKFEKKAITEGDPPAKENSDSEGGAGITKLWKAINGITGGNAITATILFIAGTCAAIFKGPALLAVAGSKLLRMPDVIRNLSKGQIKKGISDLTDSEEIRAEKLKLEKTDHKLLMEATKYEERYTNEIAELYEQYKVLYATNPQEALNVGARMGNAYEQLRNTLNKYYPNAKETIEKNFPSTQQAINAVKASVESTKQAQYSIINEQIEKELKNAIASDTFYKKYSDAEKKLIVKILLEQEGILVSSVNVLKTFGQKFGVGRESLANVLKRLEGIK